MWRLSSLSKPSEPAESILLCGAKRSSEARCCRRSRRPSPLGQLSRSCCDHVSSAKESGQGVEGPPKHGLVLMVIRKHDKICDRVFLEQSMPIERRSGRDAQSVNAAGKLRRAMMLNSPVEEVKMSISGTTRTNGTSPRGIQVLTHQELPTRCRQLRITTALSSHELTVGSNSRSREEGVRRKRRRRKRKGISSNRFPNSWSHVQVNRTYLGMSPLRKTGPWVGALGRDFF